MYARPGLWLHLRERSASSPCSVKPPKQLSLMSPPGGAGLLLSHPDPEGNIWGLTCMWGRFPIRFLTLNRLYVLSFVHTPLLGYQTGDTLATHGACFTHAGAGSSQKSNWCLGRPGYRTHAMSFPSTFHWPKRVIWLSLKTPQENNFISIVGIVESKYYLNYNLNYLNPHFSTQIFIIILYKKYSHPILRPQNFH